MGRFILGGQPCPHGPTARSGASALPNLGFPSICAQNDQIRRDNTHGDEICLGDQLCHHRQGRGLNAERSPTWGGSFVFMRTPFDAERLKSTW